MIFRKAGVNDIPQMHVVRMAVTENPLPSADLITAKDYEDFLVNRGEGWVCELQNKIVGFSVVDFEENNVWALFVHPSHEGKGIGKRLHNEMLDLYFEKTGASIWLGTAPNTRAESFYRKAGWIQTGIRPNGEIRFEMKKEDWMNSKGWKQ
jgi:ribosomal protein S18 acetylase RimI-like enzyme